MTLKIPTAAQGSLLKDMLGVTVPANLTLKLFTNNITPSASDVVATYTEFTAIMGYVAKTLTKTSFTEADVSGTATAAYAAQTWTFTAGGPVTVYGYYVVGADALLRWAELFATPLTVTNAGDAITVTPQLTFVSAF